MSAATSAKRAPHFGQDFPSRDAQRGLPGLALRVPGHSSVVHGLAEAIP